MPTNCLSCYFKAILLPIIRVDNRWAGASGGGIGSFPRSASALSAPGRHGPPQILSSITGGPGPPDAASVPFRVLPPRFPRRDGTDHLRYYRRQQVGRGLRTRHRFRSAFCLRAFRAGTARTTSDPIVDNRWAGASGRGIGSFPHFASALSAPDRTFMFANPSHRR